MANNTEYLRKGGISAPWRQRGFRRRIKRTTGGWGQGLISETKEPPRPSYSQSSAAGFSEALIAAAIVTILWKFVQDIGSFVAREAFWLSMAAMAICVNTAVNRGTTERYLQRNTRRHIQRTAYRDIYREHSAETFPLQSISVSVFIQFIQSLTESVSQLASQLAISQSVEQQSEEQSEETTQQQPSQLYYFPSTQQEEQSEELVQQSFSTQSPFPAVSHSLSALSSIPLQDPRGHMSDRGSASPHKRKHAVTLSSGSSSSKRPYSQPETKKIARLQQSNQQPLPQLQYHPDESKEAESSIGSQPITSSPRPPIFGTPTNIPSPKPSPHIVTPLSPLSEATQTQSNSTSSIPSPVADTTKPPVPEKPKMQTPRPDRLPQPGSAQSRTFDGTDVTEFIEWWEQYAGITLLTDELKCSLLLAYCTAELKEAVRCYQTWIDRDWDEFVVELKDAYEEYDSRKIKTSAAYLRQLAQKPRNTEEETRQFIREYTLYSKMAVDQARIDNSLRVSWFVAGCGEEVMKEVEREVPLGKGLHGLGTVNFDTLAKTTMKYLSNRGAIGEARRSLLESSGAATATQPTPNAQQQPRQPVPQPAQHTENRQWMPQQQQNSRFQPANSFQRDSQGDIIMSGMNRNQQATPYYNQQQQRYQQPFRPCFLCSGPHAWKTCPDFMALVSKGQLHLNERGLVIPGPLGSRNTPLRLQGIDPSEYWGIIKQAAAPFATEEQDVKPAVSASNHIRAERPPKKTTNNSVQALIQKEPRIQAFTQFRPKQPESKEPIPSSIPEPLNDPKAAKRKAERDLAELVANQTITVPIRDILRQNDSLPKLLSQMTKESLEKTALSTNRRVAFEDAEDEDFEEAITAGAKRRDAEESTAGASAVAYKNGRVVSVDDFISGCGWIDVEVNDRLQYALVDEGAESNILSRSLAMNSGLVLSEPPAIIVKSFTSAQSAPVAAALEVPVKVGPAVVKTNFLVYDNIDAGIILGRPWASAVRFSKEEMNETEETHAWWECIITDPSTKMKHTFPAAIRLGQDMTDLIAVRTKENKELNKWGRK
jgi:hypothetical protein